MGRERSGLSALRYAMDLGREHGFKHFLWWVPKVMARLCEHALKFGIETEYVRDLVKARGLVPETPPVLVKEWPWRYRIVSFGDFGILKDDKPLGVFARVQQKPLQLLKGIVGLGGENVSESALAEALWPRIDADYAHRSLTTNLHRLRKLLGEDAAVLLRHGRLSINPELCWLDLRAFDAVSRQVEDFTRRPQGPVDIDEVGEYVDAMLGVYCGPFMADEADNPMYVSLRERLRNRFLRSIGDLGRLLETSEVWDQAADPLSAQHRSGPARRGLIQTTDGLLPRARPPGGRRGGLRRMQAHLPGRARGGAFAGDHRGLRKSSA